MKKMIIGCSALFIAACTTTNTNPVSKEVNNDAEQQDKRISLVEYCESNACRKNFVLKLRTDGEPIDQILELYPPVVLGDRLSLLPGDKVYIEAEIINDRFVNLKRVSSPINTNRTITFDFSQMDGGVDMMLSVENPFDKTMKFHIDMIDFEGNPHQTSSCSVLTGVASLEHWPHAIPGIIISNIRALDSDDIMTCEY